MSFRSSSRLLHPLILVAPLAGALLACSSSVSPTDAAPSDGGIEAGPPVRDAGLDGPAPDALGTTDSDGDGISDAVELGPDPAHPLDTDGDGTPDYLDPDADGDTIADRQEGTADPDMDGVPNYLDTDSDGDGVPDAVEAGDGDISTPPAVCPNEVDPITRTRFEATPDGGVPTLYPGDGFADYEDADSDNDGLSDGEEMRLGLNPCALDSDGDGIDDAFEGAYTEVNCPDGTTPIMGAVDDACTVGHDPAGQPPTTDFYLVLPYEGPPVVRPLEFGTTIRVADVFFISDTTGSMGGTLANVKTAVASTGGLIDQIHAVIPDTFFGGGQHDDMPFSPYGFPPDQPFILAIRETDDVAMVQTAFNAMSIHNGSDGPEAQGFALWELVTGHGGTWMNGGSSYTMPDYASMCLDTGWGAPCFRDAALPIVVHFTDICSHIGPPGETSSCDPYSGITPVDPTPPLPTWMDMVAQFNARGAKYVGCNARSGSTCAGPTAPDPGQLPCYFMKRTAEETSSVDVTGHALVYDLPNSSTIATFTSTIVDAIRTIATLVPLDVDTAVRGSANPFHVDTTQFVRRRTPGCEQPAPDTIDPCWRESMGITHEGAVAAMDASSFFGVVPGTHVTFAVTFRNLIFRGQPNQSTIFIAYIDVRGGGAAVLDTREVFIIVPAIPVLLH